MPLVAAYTENSLASYMHAELSDVAVTLGWTAPGSSTGSYQQPVNRTARLYGADIAAADDMAKLEALATWQAWVSAYAALSARYDISTDGQSLSRSQPAQNALQRLRMAKAAALPYISEYTATATPITYADDPYAVRVVSS